MSQPLGCEYKRLCINVPNAMALMAFDPREASAHPPADPSLLREESALRTFTLAEGIMMLVLGTLSLIFPLVASVWVTAAVAMVLLIGGLMSWINTMARARQLDSQTAHDFGAGDRRGFSY